MATTEGIVIVHCHRLARKNKKYLETNTSALVCLLDRSFCLKFCRLWSSTFQRTKPSSAKRNTASLYPEKIVDMSRPAVVVLAWNTRVEVFARVCCCRLSPAALPRSTWVRYVPPIRVPPPTLCCDNMTWRDSCCRGIARSQVQKLKDENNVLSRKVKELDDRLFDIKRSGCGPGCGKNAPPASSSAAKEGEASTTSLSATSSWSGSQHSVSPNARTRNGAGEGAGSVGKTYNLRRRPKIAVEAEAGAGGVSTRGRRTGLRDMTNAN